MDQTTWVIVGALALVALGVTALVLRRSWGDFPERAGQGMPAAAPLATAAAAEPDADERASGPETNEVFGPISADGLVEVLHPMVLRSAAEAYRRGGPVARYIVERDGRFFFDLERIPDEAERQRANAAIEGLRAGNADMRELIQLVRRLTSEG